jgi:dephospho-CoA kinase
MHLVGITGAVASGKTLIADLLRGMNYPVFDADLFVKQLYEKDYIQSKVLNLFPGMPAIDKNYISQQIYSNEEKRLKLNKIFHPIIKEKLLQYFEQNRAFDFVFADIPLLYEACFEQYFNYVICAHAPDAVRAKRFRIRLGIDNDLLFDLINKAQMPALKKLAISDFAVYTNTIKCDVIDQLQNIIQQINK